MRTRRMRKIELMVLRADIDAVLEYVGKSGAMQISGAGSHGPEGEGRSERAETLAVLHEARTYLGLPDIASIPAEAHLPTEEASAAARALADRVLAHRARKVVAEERLASARDAVREARAFAGMSVPLSDLEHVSFLALRIGRLSPELRLEVQERLGDRALIMPLSDAADDDRVLAAASRTGRFALDTELRNSDFEPIEPPKDRTGLPDEYIRALEAEVVTLRDADAVLERERCALAEECAAGLAEVMASFAMAAMVDGVKARLDASGSVYKLEGWVPADRVRELTDGIDRVAGNRSGVRVFEPEELEAVASGEETVPTSLKHGKFVSSFERLVVSYGAPLYGTVDPTPIVAFFFLLIFAIMFGDIGQGLVILLVGVALSRGLFKGTEKWRGFGPIFTATGAASIVTGFLYGSIFANEHVLSPLMRVITSLYGDPHDRIIALLPEGNVNRLFAFFGFTLAVGVALNTIGLLINLYNQITLKHYTHAIFSKTGLAGALFFWYGIALAVRVGLGAPTGWWDVVGLGVPLLCVIFGEPISKLIEGRRPIVENGLFGFVIETLVELIESFSYYFSNTMSFLRVGAFALSHAVLSLIVFTMSDLVAASFPGGIVVSALIVVIGNLIILLLEGMIVAIQAVRLQYYEFFSKFFTDTGELFAPFTFTYRGMGT